jgi:hypothetical protein
LTQRIFSIAADNRRGQVLYFDIADFCRRQRLRQIPSLRGQPDFVLLPSPVNRLFYVSPLAVEAPRTRVQRHVEWSLIVVGAELSEV